MKQTQKEKNLMPPPQDLTAFLNWKPCGISSAGKYLAIAGTSILIMSAVSLFRELDWGLLMIYVTMFVAMFVGMNIWYRRMVYGQIGFHGFMDHQARLFGSALSFGRVPPAHVGPGLLALGYGLIGGALSSLPMGLISQEWLAVSWRLPAMIGIGTICALVSLVAQTAKTSRASK